MTIPATQTPLSGTVAPSVTVEWVGTSFRRLTIRYERRPWSLNVERQGNRWKRAALVKEWREHFADMAKGQPSMDAVNVTVQPELRNRSGEPDTGACIGAAKAAIDGLVDAGVLAEDGPKVVRSLTFLAPVVTGVDALVLTVTVADD